MRKRLHAYLAAAIFTAAATQAHAQPQQLSWAAVDKELGRPGTTQPDGVRRYSFPRTDLHVELDGVTLKPALVLSTWLGFEPMGRKSVVMGDLALTQDEVAPVMSELLKGGIQVTAIHHHVLRSAPFTVYMHIHGMGDPAQLATTVRAALARSHTPLGVPPAPAQTPVDLDTAAMDRIIGTPGKAVSGVYQFSVPRAERITLDGMEVPRSMNTGTAINFQPLGSGRAATTGDFVLLAKEVPPVMRSLRSAGIDVTSLHSHMLGEKPTFYFMHFWGVGDAAQLATRLRTALNLTNVRR